MSRLRAWLFLCAVLALEPFAYHGLAKFSRREQPLPCSCIGRSDARVRIVYLHGLDTRAPSWMELQNRAKLVALADILDARIALPRAPGSWSRSSAAAQSIYRIDEAAAECFGGRDFILLGFSDGANLVNRLFLDCRTDITRSFVSVGSSEGLTGRKAAPESGCGQIALIAGHHEPGFATTRSFARQLSKRGASATFVEHQGPHELPVEELARVLGDEGMHLDEN